MMDEQIHIDQLCKQQFIQKLSNIPSKNLSCFGTSISSNSQHFLNLQIQKNFIVLFSLYNRSF